jgi:hypothetical protein
MRWTPPPRAAGRRRAGDERRQPAGESSPVPGKADPIDLTHLFPAGARARATPIRVRARICSRSNSAKATRIVRMKAPAGVVPSAHSSVRLFTATP